MMRVFGYYPHHLYGGGYMMILGVILIGILVYWVAKKNPGFKDSSAALDILDEKFALGEISEEEYAKKKKLLRR